jgi:hypothetical protein
MLLGRLLCLGRRSSPAPRGSKRHRTEQPRVVSGYRPAREERLLPEPRCSKRPSPAGILLLRCCLGVRVLGILIPPLFGLNGFWDRDWMFYVLGTGGVTLKPSLFFCSAFQESDRLYSLCFLLSLCVVVFPGGPAKKHFLESDPAYTPYPVSRTVSRITYLSRFSQTSHLWERPGLFSTHQFFFCLFSPAELRSVAAHLLSPP